ncbi:MAG TPA: VCBS repeat-containing protein, partial [Planctomycetota bacterium]|nr:VCBS repeat-containing protein [Planctomycetota bacterium]
MRGAAGCLYLALLGGVPVAPSVAQGQLFGDLRRMMPADAGDTRAIALGDLDGDSDIDALVGDFGSIRLYLNDGSAVFTRPSSLLVPTGDTSAVALGDVDADGDLDALVGNGYASVEQDQLFLNDGSAGLTDATVQLPLVPPHYTRAVALGDVDGDGDLDAWIGYHGGPFGQPSLLYLNYGAGFFADATSQVPAIPDLIDAIALGDMDGDGDLDAFLGASGAISLPQDRLLLNDGTGVFIDATSQLPSVVPSTKAAALGDVDGDGDPDLLIGDSGSSGGGQNRLYLNDGSGTFTDATSQLPAILDVTRAVALADLDGDGDLDALIGNAGQDRLVLN